MNDTNCTKRTVLDQMSILNKITTCYILNINFNNDIAYFVPFVDKGFKGTILCAYWLPIPEFQTNPFS